MSRRSGARDETAAHVPVEMAGTTVLPGTSATLELPFARLPTQTPMALPVAVVHGRQAGAAMWISGAIHGDELNGVEIVRRVLEVVDAGALAGTLYAVPIVNVFGFIAGSRYLPDRRDLNRSFPGSQRGSLASRLAHLFLGQIVSRCTHGIDLHTATDNRTNLPQVRCDLENPEIARIARAFGAPVVLHSRQRDGSLRQAATQRGIHTLLYEGGQALRFDDDAIAAGVDGVLRVMAALKMIPRASAPASRSTKRVTESSWLRAPRSGLLRLSVRPGDRVRLRQSVGEVSDLFDESPVVLRAPRAGVVIGQTLSASVHRGDALLHVGTTRRGPIA